MILLGPPAMLAFFLAISLIGRPLLARRPARPGPRAARSWPKHGEQPQTAAAPGEEPAQPEDFEDVDGSATELTSERPGRRDNKKKRKRKQRS